MSGRPKRIANIQSYVNRADVRSYGGNLKSGSGSISWCSEKLMAQFLF